MLTELYGKGGQVCQLAKEGKLRCPLIVRPTSEDVITGNLIHTLRLLNPRWWLPDLLNAAVGAQRFRRQVFRQLELELWQNKPSYPRELLHWNEGSTQVDATITWENPPTTVYLELKYGSDLSESTAGNDGEGKYPADQLIRNLRVGLWENGWLRRPGLFSVVPRDFVLILITPRRGHLLVKKYRHADVLRESIPHGELLTQLPQSPFLGEIDYAGIVHIFREQRRWFSRPEQTAIDQMIHYLQFKGRRLCQANSNNAVMRQAQFQEFASQP